MITKLRKVLVKKPDEDYIVNDATKWHYTAIPILKNSQDEHNKFVEILKNNGVEIVYHEIEKRPRFGRFHICT